MRVIQQRDSVISERSVQYMCLSNRRRKNCVQSIIYCDHNLCRTVWFCLYLWFVIWPHVCPLLYPLSALWLLTGEPWQEAYSCEVKPKVRASKGRTASDCHRFQHWDLRTVLKLSLIVESCTDEPLCIRAFIRSDGDGGNASGRRFSNLDELLEDMKSFLRDEDDSASLIFSD